MPIAFYRFDKQFHDAYDHHSQIPDVLIFSEDFKSPLNYGFPINNPNYYYYRKHLVPLEGDELKEWTEKMEKQSPCDALKEQIKSIHAKSNRDDAGVCSYSVKKDDNAVLIYIHAACHASFNTSGCVAASTWDSYRLTLETKESVRELYEWIMNDSPWLHCIHPSWDILSARERTDRAINGPVPLNIDAPANEVAGFVVALRTISEHDRTIPTYLKLRQLGASKAVSFLLCGGLQSSDEKGFELFHNSNWHHFMSSSQSVEDLCKFFKNGYFRKGQCALPLNKKKFNYIAGQIGMEEGNGDKALSVFIANNSVKSGRGFGAVTKPDPEKIINAINEVWKNV